MERVRWLCLSLVAGVLPLSCAGVAYRYYGLEVPSYEGTLLGPEPKFDVPFSACKPIEQVKSPCVVIFQDEFFRLKQELLQLRKDLAVCQGR